MLNECFFAEWVRILNFEAGRRTSSRFICDVDWSTSGAGTSLPQSTGSICFRPLVAAAAALEAAASEAAAAAAASAVAAAAFLATVAAVADAAERLCLGASMSMGAIVVGTGARRRREVVLDKHMAVTDCHSCKRSGSASLVRVDLATATSTRSLTSCGCWSCKQRLHHFSAAGSWRRRGQTFAAGCAQAPHGGYLPLYPHTPHLLWQSFLEPLVCIATMMRSASSAQAQPGGRAEATS